MNVRRKIRLGDLLVEKKLISAAQLEEALADQKKSGRKLGRVLIENGYVAEDDMLAILSAQLNIPFIDLLHYKFKPEIVKLVPEIQARRFRSIALSQDNQGMLIGMADPTNIFAYDELSRMLQQPIRLAVVREADLLQTLDTVYRKTDEISGYAEQLSDELAESDVDLAAMLATVDVADAPVVKLLQSLFEDAIQIGASDIHIEPDEKTLRIRQRVDGILQEHEMAEVRIAQALVVRLKLLAGLDISEKRMPQDGRFSIRVKDHSIDIRMSTMPVQYGESVVMRLLDQTRGTYDLKDLGMPDDIRRRFEAIIQRPYGMVLVTGPTGSGKTTTLYAALKLLNTSEVKIITAEDPVEYRLPRISQVQVNAEIGLTFGRVLRSALRQDPDIILVGEMRDEETAEIGLRAAMTGHMVLSTLHTNDAPGTVGRLLDMGAKGYLLASALHVILAQRLVRRICRSCTRPAQIEPQQLAWAIRHGGERMTGVGFKKGAGCPHCSYTGYQGRIGVYEILEFDLGLSEVLAHGDSVAFARAARSSRGFRPLALAALQFAEEGTTTMDEVMRLSADIEALVEQPVLQTEGAAV